MRKALFTLLFCMLPILAVAADKLDSRPRVAVISAFGPEWLTLKAALAEPQSHAVNGIEFVTGRLSGRDVVLFLSGISMVNATMSTQIALNRFDISGIVFSGIAGGVDPGLNVGDVVVADKWAQYLEATFARDLGNRRYELPPWKKPEQPNYGMIFPNAVEVRRANAAPEAKFWFEVDPGMLAAARRLNDVTLQHCASGTTCLEQKPRLVLGGNGVSGQAFVDNADFRRYVFDAFQARVLDMESAAVAMVAYANGVPFIAFRSLSDLAGGEKGGNEMATFMRLASDNSAAMVRRFLEVWAPPR
ncbi:5'-methylthioadenosine/S-adenosylhomocysteine nucleosidase [Ferrovibrio sp.]|uniref:5'-methylthioadenosine/S-adenosylhomocysteine nucleosidase n=1 Tax=Ferrovibrio sp. TaxID=1917215 RepID=UPI001B7AF65A|nr:5'-methylthioadenosine/S-adenosylhomocysteine nucleosidase [Ferrovibrio sp.]MBP7064037.1 5'-methylthioadenosine/S-adenosylhomocysteine nucleosidase [Ferrovibrio sp.]